MWRLQAAGPARLERIDAVVEMQDTGLVAPFTVRGVCFRASKLCCLAPVQITS